MHKFIGIDAIEAIQAIGAKAYIRPGKRNCTWVYYTRGNDIAYLQCGDFSGYHVSTVHKPNTETGTGFRLTCDSVYDLNPIILESGFCRAPSWASGSQRTSVQKYENPKLFFESNYASSEYVELPDSETLKHAAFDLAVYAINTRELYSYVQQAMRDLRADITQGRYAPGFWAKHLTRAKARYIAEMGKDGHTANFDWVCVEQSAIAQIRDQYNDEIRGQS